MQPTNFDLVQLADAIVVASAISESRRGSDSSVRFRVGSGVKGKPVKDLTILGTSLGKPPASDWDDLVDPNPKAFQGPCIRRAFARGAHHLMGYSFARVDDRRRG